MATSQYSLSSLPYSLRVSGLKIGIAVADWNQKITHALRDGAKETLASMGFSHEQIVVLDVPGSFELPHGAQMLFKDNCDAVICLGCIVRGDTPHFDYVSQGTTQGILRAGMDAGKPCIFGVLTTDNEQQALDRAGGILGNKGSEAALAACWMLAAAQNL